MFAKTKQIFRKRKTFLAIITCDPSKITMDPPDFIVCTFMENSIGLGIGAKVRSFDSSCLNHWYGEKCMGESFQDYSLIQDLKDQL